MRRIIFMALALLASSMHGEDAKKPDGIDWQEWSPAVFEKAKTEKKLVILDLHAVWCHWCHVMDGQTYANAKVAALVKSKYIAVGVDQDSRPRPCEPLRGLRLAGHDHLRCERQGTRQAARLYPAGGNGVLCYKRLSTIPRRGLQSPAKRRCNTPRNRHCPAISARNCSRRWWTDMTKNSEAGERAGQKFLDWDNVEYCMSPANAGDERFMKMAMQTLAAQMKLIDPVWGGVDQYSTDGDWEHPHFEKIIQFQAENMRTYASAFALWNDHTYSDAATRIHGFAHNFLTSPEGSFYTSQDADVIPGDTRGNITKWTMRSDAKSASLEWTRMSTCAKTGG